MTGAFDHGGGADRLAIQSMLTAADRGRAITQFRVQKWDLDQMAWTAKRIDLRPGIEPQRRHFLLARCAPFETYQADDCNEVVDSGWVMMMNGIAGSAVTKFSATVGRIGGGISSTALAYTQTDLQASTGAANRQWELLSAAPTVGGTHAAGIIFPATFPTTDGNFAWAEFGVDSGTAGGTGASTAPLLNRGLASPGTKTSSQTWNVTVTITWA